MAKKTAPAREKSKLPFIVLAVALVGGFIWLSQTPSLANWRDQALQYIDNSDIVTLEARYQPEQILEANRRELLGTDGKKTLKGVSLKYVPYLLLEVKYPDQSKSREGVLLWGLADGEMVLDTERWETTHGFRDCLASQAQCNDLKVLQALARKQGSATVEEVQKDLHVEREVVERWVEEAKKKHLVVQKGNLLQLHFENPRLLASPQTRFRYPLVSKPLGDGQKIPRSYTKGQVVAMTQAAFGRDYAIRSEKEIFLPVYRMEVLNPDGSVQVTEWSALTGAARPLDLLRS